MSKYSFDTVSNIYVARRKFDKSHMVKTSLKVGKLTPIDVQEVLPGDGYYTKMRSIVRLSTAFLRPVMDNFFIDTYHFFVPLRLLYNNYEHVFGNPSPNAYETPDFDEFPSFTEAINVREKTVGDYLGLPTKGDLPKGISVLPFRAFAQIYEHWFRNQNTVQPMYIYNGDFNRVELPNDDKWSPTNYTGKLPSVNKLNDYFTSCLPAPQKGPGIVLPIGDRAPVTGQVSIHSSSAGGHGTKIYIEGYGTASGKPYGLGFIGGSTGALGRLMPTVDPNAQASGSSVEFDLYGNIKSGAYADLSAATAISVNDLRFAFQMQKMLEKDARGGSRYREYVRSHFGVAVADVRAEIPEYLGGMRTPLNLQQVAQTSQGSAESPLGSLGAYSQSYTRSRYSKSFDEHGYIFTLAVVRYKHSYQQGIDKLFYRSRREDFYDPLFANLGEQPVYKTQLYGYKQSAATELKGDPFGYQEAWADYRYCPDTITGEMRSNATNTFDVWHFADNYKSPPTLTEDFTNETDMFFRRATAIDGSADVDDFIAQFYFDSYVLRSMPIRSVPGLIDHH
nr:MAG: major capsid protein [Microviridae sp.]